MKTPLSRKWKLFLLLAAGVGAVLRLIYVEDMEFKDDEHYNFIQTQLIGKTDPWPWSGMPSGVFMPNPGMSIWVFVWLARIARATHPTQLAHALQFFSWLGILLLIPFALRFAREKERPIWLWTFALAMVNPFAVYYQRKLWPEPFLPFFSMLFLMGWWRRETLWGAALWGLIGACLGQIHMSGFFFAASFFILTLFFEKRALGPTRTRWGIWATTSVLGALPLLPWLAQVAKKGLGIPQSAHVNAGWNEILQLKFWVFWFSDGIGFHLGNPLGLLRGGSTWAQLSDFVRYPILGGQPTYLNGAAQVLTLGIGIFAIGRLVLFLRSFLSPRPRSGFSTSPWDPQTLLAQRAAFWGFGILLTLTGVVIRRYYMMVSFPFEGLWLVGLLACPDAEGKLSRFATPLLAALWLAQAFVSANFVGYIHVNEGATQGDYGSAFHVVRDSNLKTMGKPWPERPSF